MIIPILVLIVGLLFCTIAVLTFTLIIHGAMPYARLPVATPGRYELLCLGALVWYPSVSLTLLALSPLVVTTTVSGIGAAIFMAGHTLLASAGAALSRYFSERHKGYRLLFWCNVAIGALYLIMALASLGLVK